MSNKSAVSDYGSVLTPLEAYRGTYKGNLNGNSGTILDYNGVGGVKKSIYVDNFEKDYSYWGDNRKSNR